MTDLVRVVLFASSFRLDGTRGGRESPNITHVTLDGARTLCGRRGWETEERDNAEIVACLRCAAALAAIGGAT